jgi:hypothetical protein
MYGGFQVKWIAKTVKSFMQKTSEAGKPCYPSSVIDLRHVHSHSPGCDGGFQI